MKSKHTARRWLRSLVAALGVTTICCFWIVGPLVSPSHDAIYHWSGPAATLFIPSVLDFLAVCFAFTLLLFAAQGQGRTSLTLWAGIMLLLPLAAVENLFLFMDWHLDHWISLTLLILCILLFALFTLQFRSLPQAGLARLQRLTVKLLCVVAIGGALILVQLAWFAWQARHLDRAQLLPQLPESSVSEHHPRIIWIVLDELGYEQVYGHRFHDLALPAFDQLANDSTVFTNVVPAGLMTDVVMPSLLTGLPVDKIQPLPTGKSLLLHNPSTHHWQLFNPHNSVFSDALSAGYSTAIAGWYNPYCRILPDVLNQCFWAYGELSANRMLSQASLARNIVNPLLLSASFTHLLPASLTHGHTSEDLVAKLHISDYQQLSQAADQLLLNHSPDFILIHMSIPHPVGIYNRATHSLATRNASYIDNLALADLYLAHLRSILEAEGQWDSSAILVMGDHSWRTTQLWASAADWTHEDQLASNGGHFDNRPAYIVKLPLQKNGTRIDQPFPAVRTRSLIDAIMHRRIVSAADLSSWVNHQGSAIAPKAK